MQSGIGYQAELRALGIPVLLHLPGVGQNFQFEYGRTNYPSLTKIAKQLPERSGRVRVSLGC
jgi:choline dehydrogenase-like flavoprotein